MKAVVALTLVALCALTAQVRAADDPTVSLEGVVDLTPDTFDNYVNGKKDALVEFYAPWCGHCKHLTPEYKKVGKAVAGEAKLKSRVVIAKVDADAHRSLGERFGVKGFPTIKYFSRGKPVDSPEDYQGAREGGAFLEFIRKKLETDAGFARVETLDSYAQAFLSAADGSGALKKLSSAVEALVGDDKSNGELYMKIAKKAVEKGVDYFATETARLERILESGSLSSSKLEEVSKKLSVLGAFAPSSAEE